MTTSEPSSQSPTAAGPGLQGIGQIAIYVSDLASAKEFYGQKLGLAHLFDAGAMSFFQCGNVRLLIGSTDKPLNPGAIILYFRVADINATCAALRGLGVRIAPEPQLVARMPDHDLWLAGCSDPDGHTIEFMCEMPRSGA